MRDTGTRRGGIGRGMSTEGMIGTERAEMIETKTEIEIEIGTGGTEVETGRRGGMGTMIERGETEIGMGVGIETETEIEIGVEKEIEREM